MPKLGVDNRSGLVYLVRVGALAPVESREGGTMRNLEIKDGRGNDIHSGDKVIIAAECASKGMRGKVVAGGPADRIRPDLAPSQVQVFVYTYRGVRVYPPSGVVVVEAVDGRALATSATAAGAGDAMGRMLNQLAREGATVTRNKRHG